VGPIMATALVTGGLHWANFYAIALGFRAVSIASVGWSFWSYEKERVAQFANSLQQIASRQSAGEVGKLKLIGRALKTRTTLIGAFFIFAYQGAEVAEAGWVITYLIVSPASSVPAR
jgi:fucose permease